MKQLATRKGVLDGLRKSIHICQTCRKFTCKYFGSEHRHLLLHAKGVGQTQPVNDWIRLRFSLNNCQAYPSSLGIQTLQPCPWLSKMLRMIGAREGSGTIVRFP